MNFSENFKQTSQLCRFSPDGNYLANSIGHRLAVRDIKTLQIAQLFTCLDTIQYIEWSLDSTFVLCVMFKRGIVQVWSLDQPEWTCKIDEGSAGLVSAFWSPDARHILTTANFHLRITIWSLINKSVSYIKYPKQSKNGLDFSRDGKYMALAERRDCKDYISIFACNTWQLVKHFETETVDLAGLQWSPDGRVLCVWESALENKVLLYSIDGRCLATYSPYDLSLGVKTIAWSPSSQFLAIGSFDEKVRVLNHITWRTIVEHDHPNTINTSSSTVVYREVEKRSPLARGEPARPNEQIFSVQSQYEVVEGPVQVPIVKPDLDKANPKVGIGTLSFSPDNRYVVSKNDNMPNALWIWDIRNLCLSVLLIQASPIKCVDWDPEQVRLAICTNTNKVFLWSPAGCVSVQVPAEASFQVQLVKWHPSGKSLLLVGKEHMCVCFLDSNSNQD